MKYTSIHVKIKIMLKLFTFEDFQSINKIGLFIIILNIILYLLIFFFFLMFFFFFNLFSLKSLNELKKQNTNSFITSSFILALLSFSGMPPLFGFFGKFSIIIYFFIKNYFLHLILFFILNIFLIFFYIQNIKYLIKNNKYYFNFINNYFEILFYSNFSYLVIFFFFNISIFFFLETFFILLENMLIF